MQHVWDWAVYRISPFGHDDCISEKSSEDGVLSGLTDTQENTNLNSAHPFQPALRDLAFPGWALHPSRNFFDRWQVLWMDGNEKGVRRLLGNLLVPVKRLTQKMVKSYCVVRNWVGGFFLAIGCRMWSSQQSFAIRHCESACSFYTCMNSATGVQLKSKTLAKWVGSETCWNDNDLVWMRQSLHLPIKVQRIKWEFCFMEGIQPGDNTSSPRICCPKGLC